MAGIRCRNESYPVTANASLCSKCGQAHYLYCPLGNAAHGTDVDEFLDTIYQAGMDVERDLASEKERVEAISRSNQYLRLIDEAVDLMRRYHPQGERYYWVLYYSYLSSTKLENVEEILDKLEPHFPQYTRIHRTTYFRWREQAFEAVGSILWGYEGESERILKLICKDYEEK